MLLQRGLVAMGGSGWEEYKCCSKVTSPWLINDGGWCFQLPRMAPVLSLSLLSNYQSFFRFHVSSVIFSLPLQRPWVLPKESRCWEKGSSWAERAWSERIGRGFAGESGATLFPISCIQIVDSQSWYLRLNPCYMVTSREELGPKDDWRAGAVFVQPGEGSKGISLWLSSSQREGYRKVGETLCHGLSGQTMSGAVTGE